MAVAGLSDILSDSISLRYELVVVLTAATYVVTTSHVGLYFSQNRKENWRTFRIMVFASIRSRKSPSPYPCASFYDG
ncbi:hypothetical protein ARMGADRAFT_1070848 [Armillaria gallica]|uniref:Uncharacterized protein n=1 Tax=Armillaria gallica TaxID=47427 RepID=A0A2H3EYL5_ARMGA|nr:hypothetical protein ARMGADRAFT_1070848 [Armillaria gallica]